MQVRERTFTSEAAGAFVCGRAHFMSLNGHRRIFGAVLFAREGAR